jgi:hypothetical protein
MPLTKVSAGVIAANAVQESVGSQSITGDKLGLTAINANNIVGGSITGAKLAANTVSGDVIGQNAISSNNIVSVNASVITVGTLPKARLPSNTVLQVVSNTFGTITDTSSSGFVTSGLTASITPTSSSSRILILVSFPCTINDTARQLTYTLYRNNTTNLAPNNGGQLGYGQLYNNVGNLQGVGSLSVLDSPATTSSTAYTVYFASTNTAGAVTMFQNSLTGTITLMEIAG